MHLSFENKVALVTGAGAGLDLATAKAFAEAGASLSALIATGQVAQLQSHLNRAMDNGLTKPEVSEMLTHLAFYTSWPNVFTSLPTVKEVFEKRTNPPPG